MTHYSPSSFLSPHYTLDLFPVTVDSGDMERKHHLILIPLLGREGGRTLEGAGKRTRTSWGGKKGMKEVRKGGRGKGKRKKQGRITTGFGNFFTHNKDV